MSASTSTRRRLAALDGLRGIAVLAVMWFHVYTRSGVTFQNSFAHAVFFNLATYGWLGVPAFFIITGFVIPYSAFGHRERAASALTFMGRRLLRLYPPFVLAVLLTCLVAVTAQQTAWFKGTQEIISISDFSANAVMLAPAFGRAWVNPVFWSLLVEMQYYIIIALTMACSANYKGYDLTYFLCLAACLVSVATPPYLHSVLSWAPLFVIGHMLYLHEVGSGNRLLLVLVGAVAVAVTVWVHGYLYLFPIVLVLSLILVRWSPGVVITWIGTISYSIYLLHYPIGIRSVHFLTRFGHGDLSVGFAYIGSVITLFAVSWLFYICVERPSSILSQNVRYERIPRAAVAVAEQASQK